MKSRSKSLLLAMRRLLLGLEARFDSDFLAPDIHTDHTIAHGKWQELVIAMANIPGARVLEIGSREVTGNSRFRRRFDKASYLGFDYYPGRNVDVVGDAHRLSTYFKSTEKFDLIFSSASFEHFAMPWVVAQEIAALLKPGGHVFVETHFSYSSHERPWHFFQFSDMGLKVLSALQWDLSAWLPGFPIRSWEGFHRFHLNI